MEHTNRFHWMRVDIVDRKLHPPWMLIAHLFEADSRLLGLQTLRS